MTATSTAALAAKSAAAALAAMALLAAPAGAQDFGLDPIFGTYDLPGGFTPDPYLVNVIAGGVEDVSSRLSGCNGFVATAPDVRVNYSAAGYPLSFVVASPEGTDVTLLVNGPDGTWYCNDDMDGTTLNAGLTFSAPQSGQYDIWVGTFQPGENFEAVLAVSELINDGSAPLAEYSVGVPYDAAGYDQGPTYGLVDLYAGFLPDPHTVQILAGGAMNAFDMGGACAGFIAEAPDYGVVYEAGGLPLIFSVDSMSDTTLVIVGPNEQIYCDDDSGNGDFNPSLTFSAPMSGLYLVWVGTYQEGQLQPSVLNVSEMYSQ